MPKGIATRDWQSEEPLYKAATNNYTSNFPTTGGQTSTYGHFTAQVWKGVNQTGPARVGFGYAARVSSTGNLDLYVVARYTPVPNILGKFGLMCWHQLAELDPIKQPS